MSAGEVRPQLGADELLFRIGERNKKVSLPFVSAGLAVELGLHRRLCSDTLGRLYRRGDVNRERCARIDRRGVTRGFCFRYQISKKGQQRLQYVTKRQSLYNLLEGLKDPPESLKLKVWRPLMESSRQVQIKELVKTNRMLTHFALVDDAGASDVIPVTGEGDNRALTALWYLYVRGLACQNRSPLGITMLVKSGKRAGLTDEEIVLNALYKGALWLREKTNL